LTYVNSQDADLQDGIDSLGASKAEKTYVDQKDADLQDNINTVSGDLTTLDAEVATKMPAAEKGASEGVAPLDVNMKIPVSFLPDAILGALTYKGVWDASINNP